MMRDLRRARTYDAAGQRTRGAPPEECVPFRPATGEGWGTWYLARGRRTGPVAD